jgi:hypothetical protein
VPREDEALHRQKMSERYVIVRRIPIPS